MAAYQPDNRGHFGLALTAYAHFTSPIRRYPDLLVHRAIRYALTSGKPSDYSYSPAEMAAMAIHCSQRERRAEEAERDVDERFKCAWMEKHIGSEFDGVVTGVTSFGLFVELNESKVSGLVHISQLANDYYHFDAIRKLLKGERTGDQFRLGDHVRVQVLRASLEDRKIDFRMVPSRVAAPAPQAAGKAYNYAASGERYSLPKKPAAEAKAPGMFGRAAKAIGRAFGRKEAPVVEAPVHVERAEHPPSRSRGASSSNDSSNRSRRGSSSSASEGSSNRSSGSNRGKGQGQNRSSHSAPAPAASPSTGNRKRGPRKPKPKGKP
jgi:ribonuclease R